MAQDYICPNCDGLACDTSICPVCGNRTLLVSHSVFWSEKYNSPILDLTYSDDKNIRRIASDLRPVFPQERLLIEVILGSPMKYAENSVWSSGGNAYFVDGKRIKISYTDFLKTHSIEELRKTMNEFEEQNRPYVNNFLQSEAIQNFISLNRERLQSITSESLNYIKAMVGSRSLDEIFISFSGGKDSTVTSDLVLRALGTPSVLHFYGDTTLEYPDSAAYITRFKKAHPRTPLLISKNNEQNFLSMCEVIGPPSRVMRWCCTVFKTGAISKKIESVFKDKKQIISFQGIRRNESKSRSKYERETQSPKIAKQIAASPIIDWFDIDIWLYILSNRIDFNDAYKKGFTRVGCWCCPNNSNWSEFLSDIYMENESKEFKNFLYGFSKQIGKKDWKEYVDTGKWKARQGGNGVASSSNIVVSYEPCALEENTYNFELNRPISDRLYEFFKPFGNLDFRMGRQRLNEVYVLDRKTNNPILRITGKKGTYNLKISVVGKHPAFKSERLVESYLRAQITKFQSCLACSGCQGACKYGAITLINSDKNNLNRDNITYRIDEKKCVGCLHCVSHFDSGCLMYKVLKVQKNQKQR